MCDPVIPISQRRKLSLREMLRFPQGPTLLSLGVEIQAPVQFSMRVTQEILKELEDKGDRLGFVMRWESD